MAHAYRWANQVDRRRQTRTRAWLDRTGRGRTRRRPTRHMDRPEKLVIIVTHGPDEPELATLPFVMAAGALVSEIEVCMAFQADGVRLITKGGADDVHADGFPPLAELIDDGRRAIGGLLMPCSPCLENRGITEDDLLDGVEVIGAARLVSEIDLRHRHAQLLAPPRRPQEGPTDDATARPDRRRRPRSGARSPTPAAAPAPARSSRPRSPSAACPSAACSRS